MTLDGQTMVTVPVEGDRAVEREDLQVPRQRNADTNLACEHLLVALLRENPSSMVEEMVAPRSDSYGPRVEVVGRTVVALRNQRKVALARFLREKK